MKINESLDDNNDLDQIKESNHKVNQNTDYIDETDNDVLKYEINEEKIKNDTEVAGKPKNSEVKFAIKEHKAKFNSYALIADSKKGLRELPYFILYFIAYDLKSGVQVLNLGQNRLENHDIPTISSESENIIYEIINNGSENYFIQPFPSSIGNKKWLSLVKDDQMLYIGMIISTS